MYKDSLVVFRELVTSFHGCPKGLSYCNVRETALACLLFSIVQGGKKKKKKRSLFGFCFWSS